jgi:hypothetical protein
MCQALLTEGGRSESDFEGGGGVNFLVCDNTTIQTPTLIPHCPYHCPSHATLQNDLELA